MDGTLDRYALITGSAGGLGQVFVSALLSEGFTVFACDIKSSGLTNDKLIELEMDVTSSESIEKAKIEVLKYTNVLHILVNNAGIMHFDSLVECELIKLQRIIDVNFCGMVLVNRIFFELLYPVKGRIIITSSEIGYHQAQPFNSLYSVTKRCVDTYADSLRRELNPIGIKVIKLQPGGFKTPIIDETKRSYDAFMEKTEYFIFALKRLRPFIFFTLRSAMPPEKMRKVFLKACLKKHPRSRYRKNNLFVLKLLDLFGSRGVDIIFSIFFKKFDDS